MKTLINLILALVISVNSYAKIDTLAFVNVNVITMNSDSVLSDCVVLVSDDKILDILPQRGILSQSIVQVDCNGQYLMPGLTDGHIHLYKDQDIVFRHAPLYLSKGITTVFNMRGDSIDLAWRDLIRNKKFLAPYVYTSGEFINEPYVATSEEVKNEVIRQVESGVDFIKFHEYWSDEKRQYLTTEGLSAEAFNILMYTARKNNIPVTGHGLHDPNFEIVLDQEMSLAHLSAYQEYRLIPDGTDDFQKFSKWTNGSIIFLVVLSLVLILTTRGNKIYLIVIIISSILFFNLWFNSIWFGNDAFIYLMYASSGLIVVSVIFALLKNKIFNNITVDGVFKMILLLPLVIFIYSMVYWIPLFSKNTNKAIDQLVEKSANISVITTLLLEGPTLYNADHSEALQYISKPVAESWADIEMETPTFLSRWKNSSIKMTAWSLTQKILLDKLKNKTNLILGTDGMGFPLSLPGYGAHFELKLMNQLGLTPFEALKTATVNPPKFLKKEKIFGTIEKGKRADMVLFKENPLENLDALDDISGVMVNGAWLNRDKIDSLLSTIKQ